MEIISLLLSKTRKCLQSGLLCVFLLTSGVVFGYAAPIMPKCTYPGHELMIPIKGKVTNDKGEPLPGASIRIKGGNYTVSTDSKGEFVIEADISGTLIISYTGYKTMELALNNRNVGIVAVLQENVSQLGEVVVTALGVKRERRALGYSVTEIQGSDFTEARETNIANSLVGKVAGVNVNSVSGGPGSSANVIIRGISSLSGNNQPLYVVNGIPINNEPQGNNEGQYSRSPDLGDGISNINPDDIASISVLKGAAASALYGFRAKYGVILITTKSGTDKGLVEFNSNYVSEQVMNLTDWQYVYGNGGNNNKPANQSTAFDTGSSSWGAKLDGTDVIQFDGVLRPYSAQKNNIKNFYRSGGTFTNTIAFSKNFGEGSIRFSASNLGNLSVVPNSDLQRQTFNFSGSFNLSKRLTIDARANMIRDKADNRPILGDLAGNSNYNVMFLPTSVDVRALKPGTKADGTELQFVNNAYATNPWFTSKYFVNNTLRNRLIGSASARYTFEGGFFIELRGGQDSYNDRYTSVVPNGTAYYPLANQHISERFSKVSQFNADIYLGGRSFKILPDLKITPSAGANLMQARSESTTQNGLNFAVPYVYNILNAKNQSIQYFRPRSDVQAIYGTLDIEYKGMFYLNASGRNDWFSALWPSDKLDIFYPSISGSFVFSELLNNSWLNFGKLRAGWANVGGGLGPYQTLLTYGLLPAQLNGQPLGVISNSSIPNNELKPSNARELEIGTELRVFKDRLRLDLSWYNKRSSNEILSAPASTTSGYSGVVLNVGELENKGFEALITGAPIKGSSFVWTSSFNGSVNNNKVLSLSAGQGSLAVATSRTGTGFTQNIVGKSSNQIMAFDNKYDANGNIVLLANGIPDRGTLTAWGSAYHKWTAGWNNEFSYKRLNLSFLIDGKFGAKIFSATDAIGYTSGLHKGTLDREKSFGSINAQTYYTQSAANVSKMFVYDASFIKFRQFTLGYSFPPAMFDNLVKGASLSFVGRNLFILMKKTDNIDPEASYGGISQGLELGGVPPVRTFGLNLAVKF
ncbi:SusC/RagA family TonB-linked outer membrane protein [Daejeonella sp.]|uniref:SusC/RagA family TonB-linked outer membrane protein n=1 Tax=Daejeonella sp. TaxID=2805397 RepID=UPI002ED83AE2